MKASLKLNPQLYLILYYDIKFILFTCFHNSNSYKKTKFIQPIMNIANISSWQHSSSLLLGCMDKTSYEKWTWGYVNGHATECINQIEEIDQSICDILLKSQQLIIDGVEVDVLMTFEIVKNRKYESSGSVCRFECKGKRQGQLSNIDGDCMRMYEITQCSFMWLKDLVKIRPNHSQIYIC